MEAAEAVSNAGGDLEVDLLDGLASLADKSLVRQQEQEKGKARILMLETIREYAMEGLNASGESEAVRHRHAGYYLAQAEAASEKLDGPEQSIWLDRLESEHDNLRAALEWALQSGELEAALQLAADLYRFWYVRGYWSEGRDWLKRALAATLHIDQREAGLMSARARALNGAGWLADENGQEATRSWTVNVHSSNSPPRLVALSPQVKTVNARAVLKALPKTSLRLNRLSNHAECAGLEPRVTGRLASANSRNQIHDAPARRAAVQMAARARHDLDPIEVDEQHLLEERRHVAAEAACVANLMTVDQHRGVDVAHSAKSDRREAAGITEFLNANAGEAPQHIAEKRSSGSLELTRRDDGRRVRHFRRQQRIGAARDDDLIRKTADLENNLHVA